MTTQLKIRNLFRLKREIDEIIIKDTRPLFRLKLEIRDIRNFFQHEKGHYCKLATIINFLSNSFLNMKAMAIKIKPYQLKNILTNQTVLKRYHKFSQKI